MYDITLYIREDSYMLTFVGCVIGLCDLQFATSDLQVSLHAPLKFTFLMLIADRNLPTVAVLKFVSYLYENISYNLEIGQCIGNSPQFLTVAGLREYLLLLIPISR